MRRALATVAVVAVTAAPLAGCANKGGEGTTSRHLARNPPATATGSASAQAQQEKTVRVTVHGKDVSPNGERLKVGTGETVRLVVQADRAGTIHVHSSPDQKFHFGKGRSTITFRVKTPGIVDVEEHVADVVVLQLQVS